MLFPRVGNTVFLVGTSRQAGYFLHGFKSLIFSLWFRWALQSSGFFWDLSYDSYPRMIWLSPAIIVFIRLLSTRCSGDVKLRIDRRAYRSKPPRTNKHFPVAVFSPREDTTKRSPVLRLPRDRLSSYYSQPALLLRGSVTPYRSIAR